MTNDRGRFCAKCGACLRRGGCLQSSGRRGVWARTDWRRSIAGHPRPRSQINQPARDVVHANRLGETLYVPPVARGWFLRTAVAWGRTGATLSAPFAACIWWRRPSRSIAQPPARRKTGYWCQRWNRCSRHHRRCVRGLPLLIIRVVAARRWRCCHRHRLGRHVADVRTSHGGRAIWRSVDIATTAWLAQRCQIDLSRSPWSPFCPEFCCGCRRRDECRPPTSCCRLRGRLVGLRIGLRDAVADVAYVRTC